MIVDRQKDGWQKYRVSRWTTKEPGLEAAPRSSESGVTPRHFRRSSDPAHFSAISFSAPSLDLSRCKAAARDGRGRMISYKSRPDPNFNLRLTCLPDLVNNSKGRGRSTVMKGWVISN